MKWQEFGAAALPPAPDELGGLLPRSTHKQLLTHRSARSLLLIFNLNFIVFGIPWLPCKPKRPCMESWIDKLPVDAAAGGRNIFLPRVETQIVIPWSWCVSVDSFSWFILWTELRRIPGLAQLDWRGFPPSPNPNIFSCHSCFAGAKMLINACAFAQITNNHEILWGFIHHPWPSTDTHVNGDIYWGILQGIQSQAVKSSVWEAPLSKCGGVVSLSGVTIKC